MINWIVSAFFLDRTFSRSWFPHACKASNPRGLKFAKPGPDTNRRLQLGGTGSHGLGPKIQSFWQVLKDAEGLSSCGSELIGHPPEPFFLISDLGLYQQSLKQPSSYASWACALLDCHKLDPAIKEIEQKVGNQMMARPSPSWSRKHWDCRYTKQPIVWNEFPQIY